MSRFIVYAARAAAIYIITATDVTVTTTRNGEVIETETFETAADALEAAADDAADWTELVG